MDEELIPVRSLKLSKEIIRKRSKKRGGRALLKKGIGLLLIASEIIFGIYLYRSPFYGRVFYLFLLAFPIFMAGQWLRIGHTLTKQSLVRFTAVFVQVALLVPSIFLVFNNYSKLKNEIFARAGFL
ncbi:hypothetical protein M3197_12930 [Sporosarcina aquimarina]|uniref:hypothetical protein n=1 Tax=Sporosarcina aquimarina TaxID=114975 RepID=UPI00203D889C|nr:hypothetical protein [Sporosarcina aquimarina]MCM3758367.1 hypothetical protein [Sporosarcina aquimarina]